MRFTASGRWTDGLAPSVRQNLRWLWFDGFFVSGTEAIVTAYLSLFVLALGGNRTQIGLMSVLSSLSIALLLLPGAAIVERWGRRKQIVVLSGKGEGSRGSRYCCWLVLLAFAGPTAVYVAIALEVIRSAFANLGMPAWMSLMTDIVPFSSRGRYFSSRNMAMCVVRMITTYLVGELITRAGDPIGCQLAMGLVFVTGMASTFNFAQIEEPTTSASPQAAGRGSQVPFLPQLCAHPDFVAFCVTTALWNLSVNVAVPFGSGGSTARLTSPRMMVQCFRHVHQDIRPCPPSRSRVLVPRPGRPGLTCLSESA